MIGKLIFAASPYGTTTFDTESAGLIMTAFDITPPQPDLSFVDVPGRHGSLDFTEALGDVTFGRAKIKATFEVIPGNNITLVKRNVMVALHGKELYFQRRIEGFSSLPSSVSTKAAAYIRGRCYISASERNGINHKLTLTVDAEPFAYGALTTYTYSASGSTRTSVDLQSVATDSDCIICPEFTVTSGTCYFYNPDATTTLLGHFDVGTWSGSSWIMLNAGTKSRICFATTSGNTTTLTFKAGSRYLIGV